MPGEVAVRHVLRAFAEVFGAGEECFKIRRSEASLQRLEEALRRNVEWVKYAERMLSEDWRSERLAARAGPVSDAELAGLEALFAGAHSRPWGVSGEEREGVDGTEVRVLGDESDPDGNGSHGVGSMYHASDAALIVAAHNLLPRILRELRERRGGGSGDGSAEARA